MAPTMTTLNPLQKLNHVATILVIMGLAILFLIIGQLTAWGLDRRVPFILTGYTATAALPGDVVIVRARVTRDLNRRCSVTYSRMFFDSAGSRYDITSGAQIMNADALDDLNRRNPNGLILSVVLPPQATQGKGALVTVLDYACNPVHQLFPVPVLLTMDVDVL